MVSLLLHLLNLAKNLHAVKFYGQLQHNTKYRYVLYVIIT